MICMKSEQRCSSPRQSLTVPRSSCNSAQVPPGCCGILGLDFLTLFDWDFDIKGEKAPSPAFHGILHLSTSFYVYLHLQPSASVLFSRYNAEFTMLQAHIATAPKERKDCTSVLMADACRCFMILLAHSLKKASCLLQLLETDETGTLAV